MCSLHFLTITNVICVFPTKKGAGGSEIYTVASFNGWDFYVRKIRNKGFTLIELLVVLVVITVIGVYAGKQYKHRELVRYYNTQVERLNQTGNLIQSAVFQMGVPDSLEQMMARGYDYSCENTAGGRLDHCSHINETMWGEKINLISENNDKIHSILVPMLKLSEKERNLFIGLATKSIPHASVDGKP